MTTHLAAIFGVPRELLDFLDAGFLEVLSEDEERKTVEFHIPSRRVTEIKGNIASYSVVWIHPDFNKQFCHFYNDQPGDLVNFYVSKRNSERAEEQIDELETVDDLIDWLTAFQTADVA